jgi:excisionase family DNA binding protein
VTDVLDLVTAARELNVGVDHLEMLLASGRLPHVSVDGARRVRRDDLLSFKAVRDAERREGLRELTRLTEEVGGYEDERSG